MDGVTTAALFPAFAYKVMADWVGVSGYKREKQFADLIYSKRPTKNWYDEIRTITGFGVAGQRGELESSRVLGENQSYTTRVEQIEYQAKCAISQRALRLGEANAAEVISGRADRLMQSMRTAKNLAAASPFNNAFTSFALGDGVAAVSTSHPTGVGVQSNSGNNGVHSDFNQSAVEDMIIQITTAVDNAGHRIVLQPKKLIITPADQFRIKRITDSNLEAGSNKNDLNTLKGMFGETIIWPFLADSGEFFITTDIPERDGLRMYQFSDIETQQFDDYHIKAMFMTLSETYAFTIGDWRCLYGMKGRS